MRRTSYDTLPLVVGLALAISLPAGGGCTITETVSDILSSTTPGDWYDDNGMPRADRKVDVFVAINLENVKSDLARGQGEYLSAVRTLLHVPVEREREFFLLAQQEYPTMADRGREPVMDRLRKVAHRVGRHL